MRPGVVGRLQATKGDRVSYELLLAFAVVVFAVVFWVVVIAAAILAAELFNRRELPKRKGKR